MSALLVLLFLVVVAAAVAAGLFVAGAMAVKRNASKQLQVAEGVESKAPVNWVGAHTPEAKLHQRMVAATAELREAAADDPNLADPLAAIEQEAILLDEELVVTTSLDQASKAASLHQLEAAVTAIERVVGRAADNDAARPEPSLRESLDREIEAFDDRLEAIRRARVEVDDLDPPPPPTPATG